MFLATRRFVIKPKWVTKCLKQWAKYIFNTSAMDRMAWVTKLDYFKSLNDIDRINATQTKEWNTVREA